MRYRVTGGYLYLEPQPSETDQVLEFLGSIDPNALAEAIANNPDLGEQMGEVILYELAGIRRAQLSALEVPE